MDDIVERLRKRPFIASDDPDLYEWRKRMVEAADEIERLRGMVRIPLAVHDKDAAEYVERLRRGDIHEADHEPIAELLERQGDEIERLREALKKIIAGRSGDAADNYSYAIRVARATLSQKEGE